MRRQSKSSSLPWDCVTVCALRDQALESSSCRNCFNMPRHVCCERVPGRSVRRRRRFENNCLNCSTLDAIKTGTTLAIREILRNVRPSQAPQHHLGLAQLNEVAVGIFDKNLLGSIRPMLAGKKLGVVRFEVFFPSIEIVDSHRPMRSAIS